MFAVVKTGGKQYRVAVDDVITVEKLAAEAGSTITFQDVLMVGDANGVSVGTPTVADKPVTGEIVEHTRGDKIIVFKKKRRQHYRRRAGHRQDLTVIRITGIGDVRSEAQPKAKARATTEAPAESGDDKPAKKAAPKKAAGKTASTKTTTRKAAPKAAAEKTEE